MTKLKSIALELLQKYEESETSVIWEFSGDIAKSEDNLAAEVAKYRELIDKYAEQEPSGDAISRQVVIDLISKFILEIQTEGGRDLNAHTNNVLRQILRNVGSDRVLPSVNPQPCDDAVSRQAAIDTIESWLSCDDYNEAERHIMRAMQGVLYDLPSVQPKRQPGKWKRVSMDKYVQHAMAVYICSECNAHCIGDPKFCPSCGAEMDMADKESGE